MLLFFFSSFSALYREPNYRPHICAAANSGNAVLYYWHTMRSRAASIPNITSFHVFLGLRGVRIASVCYENEAGWLLGNMKNLFHSHRLLVMPFRYITAMPFCLTNNRCPHKPCCTGAGWTECCPLLACGNSYVFIIIISSTVVEFLSHDNLIGF